MLNNIEFIFVHIEKCMGTSLRLMFFNYLKNIYNSDKIYIPELYDININLTNTKNYNYLKNLPNDFKVLLCHISYNNVIIKKLFNNPFLVTCVKNPYQRIISHYYYFEKNKYNNKRIHELDNKEIIKFLNSSGNIITFRIISEDCNNLIDTELIKKKIDKFNCVIILENLDEDIKCLNSILNEKYNINVEIKLEKKNCNFQNYKNIIDLDLNYLKEYEKYFLNDINVYNYIISLPVNKRFKL
jgi:hypothetical protein